MRLACIACLLFLFVACKETGGEKDTISVPGAYKLLSVSIKSEKVDTSYTNMNQLKIYTADAMMYVQINSPDSVSAFGVGSYSINKDTITENVFYTSNDSISNDKPETFKLFIEKTVKGYNQFIAGMQNSAGEKFNLIESYELVRKGTISPLDGAWKLVKRYTIKGNDTTISDAGTQYKMYYSGFCMWGAKWKDSLNKAHTGIGYGPFDMIGDTKVKQSVMVSTFYDVRGRDFDLDIEMIGNDGFRQTVIDAAGTKSVEEYERLMK